jgi:hypothetical protein
MKNKVDRCYFCGTLSQYNFSMQTPVCSRHWDMMCHIDVPNHIPDEQMLNYKKEILAKKLKEFR